MNYTTLERRWHCREDEVRLNRRLAPDVYLGRHEATRRELLRRRVVGPSISDAGEALLERVRTEFEPVTELGVGEHIRIDATGPPEAAVRAALGVLHA